MSLATAELPSDPDALRAFAAALQAELYAKTLHVEKLKAQLATLRRARFGQSSEKLDRQIDLLELVIGDLEEAEAENEARQDAAAATAGAAARHKPERSGNRRPLPPHLPREIVAHPGVCACPVCGSERLRKIDDDEREVLEYVPSHFKVIVHQRPKLSCRDCETITQPPMPTLPIERGRPGAGLIAHVVVSKFCDHLPLNRQSEIYAREGVELERSTLADWVGRAAWLLGPLAARIGDYVRAGPTIHADDTPIPVQDPGRGRTKSGRLWVVVRDEGTWGSSNPPAAYYRYSSDRKGEHAQALLASARGFLHADAYAGFDKLYEPDPETGRPRLEPVACWAHLWMPPLLQGSSEQRRHDKRLQSSIRPSRGEHPASPAVMVRSADRAQSQLTSSKLDAPSGLLRSRSRRSPSHAHCPSRRFSRRASPAESLVYAA